MDALALPPVLDACCGPRMFWFDKADARALFVDKRSGELFADTRDRRRARVVMPDQVADFTSLLFPDNTFALVVFDPPHTFAGPNGRTAAARVAAKMYGENAFTLKRYGRSSTWIATSNKQVRRVEAAPGETT